VSKTKPLSATKIANLAHVFKAIEDARINNQPTVYLTHSRPKSLYYDLTRARTTLYPQWKGGAVKFFLQEHGIEVRINLAPELVELPKGEIPVSTITSYTKIGSHLLDVKPHAARFSRAALSDEEVIKLEKLAQHLKYNVIRDAETLTFSRT
jgi:hypothetical protein